MAGRHGHAGGHSTLSVDRCPGAAGESILWAPRTCSSPWRLEVSPCSADSGEINSTIEPHYWTPPFTRGANPMARKQQTDEHNASGRAGRRRGPRSGGVARTPAGAVIEPQDPLYDEARAVWNGMIDVRPRAVIRAGAVGDIDPVLDTARRTGLPLAVRGGGAATSPATALSTAASCWIWASCAVWTSTSNAGS